MTALAPVKDALIFDAEAEASTVRAEADERADALLATARSRAATIVAAGEANGTAEAAGVVRTELVRNRRQARARVLAAQRELYEELLGRCREAGRALSVDPDYPHLLEALRGRAVAILGANATITKSPDGGLVATAGTRRLDLTLPRLVEDAVERLGGEVRRLWQD